MGEVLNLALFQCGRVVTSGTPNNAKRFLTSKLIGYLTALAYRCLEFKSSFSL